MALGGLLDAGLQLVGEPEVDARRGGVVGVARGFDWLRCGISRCHGDHELGLAAAQAHVHRAGGEVARDLRGRLAQRFQQRQAEHGVQRRREPLGQRACVLASGLGGHRELAANLLDISL